MCVCVCVYIAEASLEITGHTHKGQSLSRLQRFRRSHYESGNQDYDANDSLYVLNNSYDEDINTSDDDPNDSSDDNYHNEPQECCNCRGDEMLRVRV